MPKQNIYRNIEKGKNDDNDNEKATQVSPVAEVPTKHKQVFDNISFQNEGLVQLYRGKFLHKLCTVRMNIPVVQRYNKVMVFDLDETIGSFGEFVILLHYLERILGQQQPLFNELLDLYPRFLRYGILNVFHFLNQKKKQNECYKIYIYTNNKYSPEFPQQIQSYIDYKLDTTGFIDKIICAFKIGDRIIEPSRTTMDKTHSDFIQCTMLPKQTEICFVDNTLYGDMKHNKIFYIQPRNYYHKMEWRQIVNIFVESPVYSKYLDVSKLGEMREQLYSLRPGVPMYISANNSDDIAVYQKLKYYVNEFFLLTTRREKTKKMKYSLGKFTRKKKKKC